MILLAAMKKPPFAGGEIFDRLLEIPEEKRADALRLLGEEVAAKLREGMAKVAEQGNLIYESAYRGLALLGTTMTATLYREGEDYVDALYFLAGDSRPYLLDKDGLVQTVADQEGKDGGMTNFIHVTEGTSFTLDCKYFRFPKPTFFLTPATVALIRPCSRSRPLPLKSFSLRRSWPPPILML